MPELKYQDSEKGFKKDQETSATDFWSSAIWSWEGFEEQLCLVSVVGEDGERL